jgi:hypothetical protein
LVLINVAEESVAFICKGEERLSREKSVYLLTKLHGVISEFTVEGTVGFYCSSVARTLAEVRIFGTYDDSRDCSVLSSGNYVYYYYYSLLTGTLLFSTEISRTAIGIEAGIDELYPCSHPIT